MSALGVDIGGTFTDFVLVDDAGRVRVHKRPTSPADPAQSFLEGVAELGVSATAEIIHGSTIATNALLEQRGARTALVTTAGFADVLEIGRQHRPDLYALGPVKPPPLVPRAWRYELHERITAAGAVLTPLDPAEVEQLAAQLIAAGIESVAVCGLFAFLRPAHEQLVRAILQRVAPELYLSLSSELLPEYREYERTATTVTNAYVTPLIDRYLARLEAGLAGRPLRIMQSNGGTLSAARARTQAARLALSGPAGGVVGALAAARQALGEGAELNLITFDMGGTSTDVALCPGRLPLTAEGEIGGLPLRLPLIDVHTIGAGGGSLAQVDAGGALQIGPASAGAEPGPAAYGRGGVQPTVTDAQVVLGRLDPQRFLGGRMMLDEAAARAALSQLAVTLHAPSAEAAAWDVLRVATAAIERAVRRISIERGYDPRRFTLVAFGGAGPLQVCELAEQLGISRVLLPRAPGVLSALGMLLADRVKDYSLTALRPAAGLTAAELAALYAPLLARAQAELAAEGATAITLERLLDTRYAGQSFELSVPLPSDPAADVIPAWLAAFHALHDQRYGHAHPGDPVELVTLRLRASAPATPVQFEPLPLRSAGQALRLVAERAVWFAVAGSVQPLATPIYARDALHPGDTLTGPALLVQLDATTVLPPGWRGVVDAAGHILLTALVTTEPFTI